MTQKDKDELEKQIEEHSDYSSDSNRATNNSEKMQSPEPWPEPPKKENEGDK